MKAASHRCACMLHRQPHHHFPLGFKMKFFSYVMVLLGDASRTFRFRVIFCDSLFLYSQKRSGLKNTIFLVAAI